MYAQLLMHERKVREVSQEVLVSLHESIDLADKAIVVLHEITETLRSLLPEGEKDIEQSLLPEFIEEGRKES